MSGLALPKTSTLCHRPRTLTPIGVAEAPLLAQDNRRDLASPWELLTGKTCPVNVRRLRYMWTGISPTSGLGPRELAINGTGEPRDARHDRRRGASFLQTQ